MSYIKKFLLPLALIILGCAPHKETLIEKPNQKDIAKVETQEMMEVKVLPEAVREYAQLHQISDLKVAEFYLTHPEYAKANPYEPTEEDLMFYEGKFLEKMYPEFKKLVEKEGFKRARQRLMNNPPAGPGSMWIGSRRYGQIMQRLADTSGEGASTGLGNALLQEDPAAVNYQRALSLYQYKRLDEAIQHMEKAVNSKPDSPTMQYNLGIMYMEKGENAKAIRAFQKAIELIKETGYTKINLKMYPDVYLGSLNNLGLLYTRIGMYSEAMSVLEEAIKFRPDDIETNHNIGIAYYIMGENGKAEQHLKKFLSSNDGDAETLNLLGLMAYNQGLYEEALQYFRSALEKRPSEKQYSYNEGLALAALGRHEEAKDAFKRAEGLKEGQEMRSNFIEQLEANKWRQLYNEAHTAMELGYYEKAIPLFESAVSLKPDMLEAHVNLGISYGKIGDKQKQIYHLQKANSLDPNVYEVHFNLGLAYAESLMFDQAISEFKRAIELKPDSKDPYFSLGTALFNMDRYAEASEQFKKCIELSPAWFQAQMSLALCYIRMGKPYDAIKHLQEAIKINPNSADAHYNLGVAYTKMGDIEKASEQFRKALDISPGHRLARLSLKEIESYKNINSK